MTAQNKLTKNRSSLAYPVLYKSKKVSLIDVLDRILDKGAVVDGELTIRIADIDLIFVGLRLLVTSVSRAEKLRKGNGIQRPGAEVAPQRVERLSQGTRGNSAAQRKGNIGTGTFKPTKEDLEYLQELEREIQKAERNIPKIIDAGNPKKAERGIAKLVLTLVEFIRKVLEKESMRRIDAGNLSDIEIQKLGLTLKALEKKIEELKAVFGIKEKLNLELGPLGNLM